ncbi:methyltransferase domain-containing protein [Salinisphaera sp. SPP-AMP-43]|uniref:glycine/sarcosine N-methyltransferase n=1 Tax=Salinisphaera sp. SPP-AMP-43 TaxID=3121288 RepID=UPI003C6E81C1
MSSDPTADPMFQREQDFGDAPTEIRETDHYQHEYVHDFVERWDDLIDWDGRAASEGSFFIDVLKRYGCKTVIDAACGTGFHSVQLLRAGFEVASVDGSPQMLSKAFDNARDRGFILKTVHTDWRWLTRDMVGRYDAIICLGNSFTHIFNEHDRRRALAEFYSMLKHDGILILDQRNYDALLDGKSGGPSHKYYYCGDGVTAEPEHIDEGLARFRYQFSDDGSVYHLNMFPLRKSYVHDLMHQVGFQKVTTYGDFQSSYREQDPDFFINVAEKSYLLEDADEEGEAAKDDSGYSPAVKTAQNYYNSDDADNFYSRLWGGEDIHIGLYQSDDEPVLGASHRTVARMGELAADQLGAQAKVLDIGGGYGGSARYLAEHYGAHVVSLNLSEVQNQRARRQTAERGLDDRVDIVDGDFENIPYADASFDVVWSQDAILHSGNRTRVLDEAVRVLKPGGLFVFTDPMMADGCPSDVLQPVLDRIQLETMGSPGFYRKELTRRGLTERVFEDHTQQVPRHYGGIKRELAAREAELDGHISQTYIANMKKGLQHWVDAGNAGHLAWGIMVFEK